MKLRISSIADRGVPDKERLVLRIMAETDIGEYVILRTLVRGEAVTTGVKESYWFADKTVSVGDQVILYSKSGTPSEKILESGHVAHFYYWGHKGEALWTSSEFGAVVIHADEWISHIPDST